MAESIQLRSASVLLLLVLATAFFIAAVAGSWERTESHGNQVAESFGMAVKELTEQRAVAMKASPCPMRAAARRIKLSVQQTWRRWWKAVAGQHKPPQAHPWPEEFSIRFTTKGDLVEGALDYDWSNKRQVIWHAANSSLCEGYGVPNDPCYQLFNDTGIYTILPSLRQCWLDTPGVGSVPPEWTVQGEYLGTWGYSGVGPCRNFGFPPTAHVYAETLDARPCVFVFPSPDMTYYFLPDTLVLGAPDEAIFELPSYCTPTRPVMSKPQIEAEAAGGWFSFRDFLWSFA